MSYVYDEWDRYYEEDFISRGLMPMSDGNFRLMPVPTVVDAATIARRNKRNKYAAARHAILTPEQREAKRARDRAAYKVRKAKTDAAIAAITSAAVASIRGFTPIVYPAATPPTTTTDASDNVDAYNSDDDPYS